MDRVDGRLCFCNLHDRACRECRRVQPFCFWRRARDPWRTMGRGCATSLLSCIVWCVCVVWHAYALRVGVIHYRPSSMPIKAFEVGFVSAMSVLEKDGDIEVEWINCDSFNGKRPEDLNLDRRFDHLDILMVKSNWDWSVDSFVRAHLRNVRVPKMLLISGVTPPPKGGDLHFYDVI